LKKKQFKGFGKFSALDWVILILILLAFAMNTGLFITLYFFTKFHISLVLANLTTIENLDKNRKNP